MSTPDNRRRAAEAETAMREFLINFTPCHELKLADVLSIAFFVRSIVFEALNKAEGN